MGYSIIDTGRGHRKQAEAIFTGLSNQEQQRNQTEKALKDAKAQQTTGAIGSTAGIVGSEMIANGAFDSAAAAGAEAAKDTALLAADFTAPTVESVLAGGAAETAAATGAAATEAAAVGAGTAVAEGAAAGGAAAAGGGLTGALGAIGPVGWIALGGLALSQLF